MSRNRTPIAPVSHLEALLSEFDADLVDVEISEALQLKARRAAVQPGTLTVNLAPLTAFLEAAQGAAQDPEKNVVVEGFLNDDRQPGWARLAVALVALHEGGVTKFARHTASLAAQKDLRAFYLNNRMQNMPLSAARRLRLASAGVLFHRALLSVRDLPEVVTEATRVSWKADLSNLSYHIEWPQVWDQDMFSYVRDTLESLESSLAPESYATLLLTFCRESDGFNPARTYHRQTLALAADVLSGLEVLPQVPHLVKNAELDQVVRSLLLRNEKKYSVLAGFVLQGLGSTDCPLSAETIVSLASDPEAAFGLPEALKGASSLFVVMATLQILRWEKTPVPATAGRVLGLLTNRRDTAWWTDVAGAQAALTPLGNLLAAMLAYRLAPSAGYSTSRPEAELIEIAPAWVKNRLAVLSWEDYAPFEGMCGVHWRASPRPARSLSPTGSSPPWQVPSLPWAARPRSSSRSCPRSC